MPEFCNWIDRLVDTVSWPTDNIIVLSGTTDNVKRNNS